VVASGVATRVLVTGGAGFIGSHVAERVLVGGVAVRALDNLDRRSIPKANVPPTSIPRSSLSLATFATAPPYAVRWTTSRR
jgi:nucleoside-diphosphate-sugar epimerase